ncbi:Nuclear matrix constituent protein 1-like protein [Drosera capensis]
MMFTPHRTPSSLTPPPRTSATASQKGKAVAYTDGPLVPVEEREEKGMPPPLRSLEVAGDEGGDSEDWRRFREAGLLDERAMVMRDRLVLAEKIERLKRELFDYQYNMGVLLLERNDLSSKCEELTQEVSEAEEILKRQQAANVLAFGEAERRVENLRRALDHERKRVLDLEKALQETYEDCEKLKASSMGEIAEAEAKKGEMEEKGREVEEKLQSASRKHAEADSKLSQLERQTQELEARENILKSEQLSLSVEREAHEDTYRKQKEGVMEWERKLQQVEERHCKQRSALKEREEELNEREETYRSKQNELERLQKNTDSMLLSLHDKENDISNRLSELVSNEEKIEARVRDLQYREKQALALEEKLHFKERVEIPNLLDEHRNILSAELQEFQLELQQKRSMVDEEFKTKFDVFEKRKTNISHLEAMLGKRDETLETKSEKIKVKEEELEAKIKSSMEKNKQLDSEEKELEGVKQLVLSEKDILQVLRDDIQRLNGEVEEKEAHIHEEIEKLKTNKVKRVEHFRLQKELKEEMGRWKHQNTIVKKEIEDLKRDRLKFKRDWGALHEKQASIADELKKTEEEKLRLEKQWSSAEQSLKEKNFKMKEKTAEHMEAVRTEKESFSATKEHELFVIAEKAQNEQAKTVQHFDLLWKQHEEKMHKNHEELEDRLNQSKRLFEEERLEKIRNMNALKEVAEKRREEMESCQLQTKREKQELASSRKLLEEDQIEIREDIRTVTSLSKKLKEEREELINERSSFLAFVEKVKGCSTCGDSARDFALSDFLLAKDDESQPPLALDNKMLNVRPQAPTDGGSHHAGRRMPLVQKCASSIRKLLPEKKVGDSTQDGDTLCYGSDSFSGRKFDALSATHISDRGEARAQSLADLSPGVNVKTTVSSDVQEVLLNNIMAKAEREDSQSIINLSTDFTEVQVPEESQLSEVPEGSQLSEVPEDSQLSELQSIQRKPGKKRKAGVRGKRPAKAVVVDATLKETSKSKELDVDKQHLDSVHAGGEGAERLPCRRFKSQVTRSTGSEQNTDLSEGPADSEAVGGSKRRKTLSLASQPPVEPRYNFRLRKTTSASLNTVRNSRKPPKDDELAGIDAKEVTSDHEKRGHSMRTSSAENNKPSSEPIVKLRTTSAAADDDTLITSAVVENVSFYGDADSTVEIIEEGDESPFGDDGSDDGHDQSSDDPALVSVGKQIWNFFTT